MNSVTAAVPITLVCHPQTPCQAIQGIEVLVGVAAGHGLTLTFALESDLSRLRIPDPGQPGCAAGLWRHTCFEAFVMAHEGPGYREFNFSPSGQWAVFAFRNYRDGGELDCEWIPEIAVRRTVNRLELDAQIGQGFLPQGRPLRLGLCAVVEDADGVLSYWALQHPAGKPDFHHSDSFAMALP
jgi:hypothetical protein